MACQSFDQRAATMLAILGILELQGSSGGNGETSSSTGFAGPFALPGDNQHALLFGSGSRDCFAEKLGYRVIPKAAFILTGHRSPMHFQLTEKREMEK